MGFRKAWEKIFHIHTDKLLGFPFSSSGRKILYFLEMEKPMRVFPSFSSFYSPSVMFLNDKVYYYGIGEPSFLISTLHQIGRPECSERYILGVPEDDYLPPKFVSLLSLVREKSECAKCRHFLPAVRLGRDLFCAGPLRRARAVIFVGREGRKRKRFYPERAWYVWGEKMVLSSGEKMYVYRVPKKLKRKFLGELGLLKALPFLMREDVEVVVDRGSNVVFMGNISEEERREMKALLKNFSDMGDFLLWRAGNIEAAVVGEVNGVEVRIPTVYSSFRITKFMEWIYSFSPLILKTKRIMIFMRW